jgi:hypothetical protein
MFMRPPPTKTNESDYKDDRLQYFIDHHLRKFDIICFQELFHLLNPRKQKMITAGKESGFPYHAVSTAPSFFSEAITDGGLLTLSRFPILCQVFHPF